MEDVAASIKEKVLIINSSLEEDEDYLDYVIDSVINKALLYMNRYQFVKNYEEAMADLEEGETEADLSDDISIPIPQPLYTVLAEVVVGLYRTIQNNNTAETGNIKSIKDQGQEITFSDQMASFLATSSDSDVFAGSTEAMNNFRVATVVDNSSSNYPKI